MYHGVAYNINMHQQTSSVWGLDVRLEVQKWQEMEDKVHPRRQKRSA